MTVEVEKKDHVAYITLNRPEARNALDLDTVKALAEAWEDFRDDASMRVAIITGVDKSFCAGADLTMMLGSTIRRWLTIFWQGRLRVQNKRCATCSSAVLRESVAMVDLIRLGRFAGCRLSSPMLTGARTRKLWDAS